jgi:hypothetical protein
MFWPSFDSPGTPKITISNLKDHGVRRRQNRGRELGEGMKQDPTLFSYNANRHVTMQHLAKQANGTEDENFLGSTSARFF